MDEEMKRIKELMFMEYVVFGEGRMAALKKGLQIYAVFKKYDRWMPPMKVDDAHRFVCNGYEYQDVKFRTSKIGEHLDGVYIPSRTYPPSCRRPAPNGGYNEGDLDNRTTTIIVSRSRFSFLFMNVSVVRVKIVKYIKRMLD
jgi:hypothetical protein